MLKQDQVLHTKPLSIKTLYDDYAAMLLGFIEEVTGNKKVAEDYLARIFSSLAKQFNVIDWNNGSNWCNLHRYAKDQLSTFDHIAAGCAVSDNLNTSNRYLNNMTKQQKLVFCSVYYSKKTTAQLAAEIKQPEELVRKLLREAFTIIRKSNEN